MGLLGNFVRENQSVRRCYGGGAVSLSRGNLSTSRKALWRHFLLREGESTARATVGKPHGYYPPAAWRLPLQGGATVGYSVLGVAASGDPANGVALSGAATLSVEGAAVGNLVVSAIGSATIGVEASGAIAGVASGSGVATISGEASAIAGAVGYLSGTAGLSVSASAACYGLGYCSGTTAVIDELSPAGLAAAVWGADAATYSVPGTLGAKLNAASSAGDPWGTALPGSYAPGTAGAIMGSQTPESVAAAVWAKELP